MLGLLDQAGGRRLDVLMTQHHWTIVGVCGLGSNDMRTTVSIDDDVLAAVRYLAEQQRVALGKVLSDLARKGLQKQAKTTQHGDFPVFSVSENAAPITLEQVKMLDDGA